MSDKWGNKEEYLTAKRLFQDYMRLPPDAPWADRIDKAIECIQTVLKSADVFFRETGSYAWGPEDEFKRFRSDAAMLCAEHGDKEFPSLPPHIDDQTHSGIQELLVWFIHAKSLVGPVDRKKQKGKTRKRGTQKEVTRRNELIAIKADEFEAECGRLATVAEIAERTGYNSKEVYRSPTYKAGKIASKSAIVTKELAGRSVSETEYFSDKSARGSQVSRESRARQDLINALIEKQRRDNSSDYVID